MESLDFIAKARIIAPTMIRTNKAAENIKPRKNASPVLPVGESAIRHGLARALAVRLDEFGILLPPPDGLYLKGLPPDVIEFILVSARLTISAGNGAY